MTNSTTFPGSLSCPTSTVSNAMTLGTTKTFVVTVSDGAFYIDGVIRKPLELHQGQTYIFDLSSSTLSGHPFVFDSSNSNDGTTDSDPYYTTGITTTGTYGSSEKRTFIVPVGALTTLYYYCTIHSGMGASVSISPTSELVVSGHVKSTDLVVSGTGGVALGGGTTAERPSNPTTGTIRYNSTIGFMESYLGTGWAPIARQHTVTGVSPTTTAASGGVAPGWSQQKIVASVNSWGNADDEFGYSVAMSSDGTRVIVGAPYEDSITNAGAAYIFTYNESTSTWSQEAKLLSSDLAGTHKLGSAVSITGDGTRVIVGAYGEYRVWGEEGAAYIFVYSGGSWSQEAKLMASDGALNDHFGEQVAMSVDGTKVIVGVANDDDKGTDAGAAYIFTYSSGSWDTGTKIVAADGQSQDKFGFSVAINGDGTKIIVGAYKEDFNSDQGAAYIFVYSDGSWTEQIKLRASDGASNDWFGENVAMSGDGTKVIVGARTPADQSGAAYIFTYSSGSWDTGTKIFAADGQAGDRFGEGGVAINGDGTKVIVGATSEDTNGSLAGAVYIFGYNESTSTWSQEAVFRGEAAGDEISDHFGVAINGDGTKIIHGSRKHNYHIGAAYIATYNENQRPPATQVFTATGSGIITGSTVQLEGVDGTLYGVVDATPPNAAGTQVTFKMGGIETEFPPSAMTNNTSITGYVASASMYNSGHAYRAFMDFVNTTYYWTAAPGNATSGYSTSSPFLAGSSAPLTDSHRGHWLQLQIPSPVILSRAVIGTTSSGYQHGQFVILGSNNGTNWTLLHAGTGTTLSTNVTTLSEGVTTTFTYFRVVIKSKFNGTGHSIELNNVQFFDGLGEWVVSNQPYKIRVTAPNGLIATSTATIGLPVVWTTAVGAVLKFGASTTQTLAGTDGGGGTNRTFSLAPGSNALPSGLTLTGSTGAITGQVLTSQAGVTTTVTFRLTDNGSGQFADREIGISGASWEILMSTGGFMGASWASGTNTAFGSPGSASFKSATATTTGASGRTAFGDGYGLYNAFFTKTNITRIAIVDGSGNIQDPTAHGRYVLYDLVSGGTGSETIYEIIDRLDTYNLNNANWAGNDNSFQSPSVTNFTAGSTGYSGTLATLANGNPARAGNITTHTNGSADFFCIWGVNNDSDNDTQVLCAYSGSLAVGNGKSDSWRGTSPLHTAWSYWGNDWHSDTRTQTISKGVQTTPGRPTTVPYGGGIQYYLMAFG